MKANKPPSEIIKDLPNIGTNITTCKTCANKEWADEVDALFVQATVTHKNWSKHQLWKLLQAWGYGLSCSAMTRHLQDHRPPIWKAWNERNKETQ